MILHGHTLNIITWVTERIYIEGVTETFMSKMKGASIPGNRGYRDYVYQEVHRG